MLCGLSLHGFFFLNCNLQFTLILPFLLSSQSVLSKNVYSMTRIVQLISRYVCLFFIRLLSFLFISFTLHLAVHQTGFTELKVVVSFYSGNTKKVVARNYFFEPPCKICYKKISHYQGHECQDEM